MPIEPHSLVDLQIPASYKVTSNRDNFLIHDIGEGSRNRIIMFVSEIQLRTLASAKTWFMDGTFSMASAIFSQLYVIQILFGLCGVSDKQTDLLDNSYYFHREVA